jgi:hypothetical protein
VCPNTHKHDGRRLNQARVTRATLVALVALPLPAPPSWNFLIDCEVSRAEKKRKKEKKTQGIARARKKKHVVG